MSVDECITTYGELVEEALPASYSKEARDLSDKSEYGFSPMAIGKALQRLVSERLGDRDTPLHDDKCTYT